MLRTSTFYGLWACYFIGCLAGLMAIGIAKPVGTDVGIETGLATMLVGVFAVFNGFGRPFAIVSGQSLQITVLTSVLQVIPRSQKSMGKVLTSLSERY